MHYYTHNFGDYSKDAGHLTTLQHGIYRLLMDAYYVTEQPIPVAKAHRIARADKAEVEVVLCDFFEMSQDGTVWTHKRIDAEIAAYHAKAAKNRVNGLSGGRPKKLKPSGNPSGSVSVSEQEPKQKANRKPETKNQDKDPLNPPEGGKSARVKGSKLTLEQFITGLEGEKAFAPEDPLFDYTEEINLPKSYVKLAWLEFRVRISPSKQYVDWRQAFRNYVRGNFLKLWYQDDNEEWQLTTAGKQAWTAHRKEIE